MTGKTPCRLGLCCFDKGFLQKERYDGQGFTLLVKEKVKEWR